MGITGGIAAYKSADLCRQFVKAGATVQVIMSEAATEFITPLTMETLSGRPVQWKMFTTNRQRVEHIALSDDADLFVIAPATADYLARCAVGRADDLISAVTLAFTEPVLAAPAMNTKMWRNPATQRNISTLREGHGWRFVEPGEGDLACGWAGPGRMAEPTEIFEAAQHLLRGDLSGLKILVTAGPTVEDIDPVRFFSNRSSGKMGYAIAEVAAARGAEVTLVSGPTSLLPPRECTFVSVRSALEMERAVQDCAENQDAIVMSAAVADFRPKQTSKQKLKKEEGEEERVVHLVRNPDILAGLGRRFEKRNRPILVGFALETQNLERAAREKLEKKKADLIVANLAEHGFGGDHNQALIVDASLQSVKTGQVTKKQLADQILDRIKERLPNHDSR